MMSGSSHAADRQLLDVVNKSPPVSEVVTASVLVEPLRDAAQGPRSRRSSSCTQTDEETIKPLDGAALVLADNPAGAVDAGGDRTDGAIKVNSVKPPYPEEPEEDGCGVKCLYYTMQCCECAIM